MRCNLLGVHTAEFGKRRRGVVDTVMRPQLLAVFMLPFRQEVITAATEHIPVVGLSLILYPRINLIFDLTLAIMLESVFSLISFIFIYY